MQAQISGVQTGPARAAGGRKLGSSKTSEMWWAQLTKTPASAYLASSKVLPGNPYYTEPIPVALAHQVKKGPAEILTVLEGERVERF